MRGTRTFDVSWQMQAAPVITSRWQCKVNQHVALLPSTAKHTFTGYYQGSG